MDVQLLDLLAAIVLHTRTIIFVTVPMPNSHFCRMTDGLSLFFPRINFPFIAGAWVEAPYMIFRGVRMYKISLCSAGFSSS